MPLRIKCKGCGQKILVDEVFQGARCRCSGCRHLMEVPRVAAVAPQRPLFRPEHPPLLAHSSSRAAVIQPRPAPRAAKIAKPHPIFTKVTPFRVAASATVVFVIMLGGYVWHHTTPSNTKRTPSILDSGLAQRGATTTTEDVDTLDDAAIGTSAVAILNADPKRTYFGVPLSGKTIGFVVDCDSAMSSYLDHVAFLTNSVNASLKAGTRFGIVQATSGSEGNQLSEVFEPSTDLMGAATVLQSRLAGGKTDLTKALARTEGWYADQVFVLLAKHVDATEMQQLRQHAEQTGSVTHVIAFGEAAKQDLSPISGATGGKFIPVSDQLLSDLVKVHQEKMNEAEPSH